MATKLAVSEVTEIVQPVRPAVMGFDLVACDDVWLTFAMIIQTVHLDAVAMISAYFVDASVQGQTSQCWLVLNSMAVSNSSDKRFEDAIEILKSNKRDEIRNCCIGMRYHRSYK